MCVCMCVHSKSTLPTHLHGLLQVHGGCTEAVEGEGEVLYNCVGPTHTSRGHHTKSPPLHLTDVHVNIQYK